MVLIQKNTLAVNAVIPVLTCSRLRRSAHTGVNGTCAYVTRRTRLPTLVQVTYISDDGRAAENHVTYVSLQVCISEITE